MQSIFPNGRCRSLFCWSVAAVFAYLCGCFNGAVIVSKYILRNDVRNHGSGNAGLTNFFRTFGGPLTFVVILCDVLKGQSLHYWWEQWLMSMAIQIFISAEDTTILWLTFAKYSSRVFSACWVMCSHACFSSRAVRASFPEYLSHYDRLAHRRCGLGRLPDFDCPDLVCFWLSGPGPAFYQLETATPRR